jgi:hypothetical protein
MMTITPNDWAIACFIGLFALVLLAAAALLLRPIPNYGRSLGIGIPPWINRHGNLLRCLRRAVGGRQGRNRV